MDFLPIRFAEFTLDVANAQLSRDGHIVRLRPKTFDVLRCLVERRGSLVTKDELLEAVWPGIAVGDANLQLCLSEIRKALGEDPKTPRFIQTVHRRGYRFRVDAVQAPTRPLVGRTRELDLLTARLRDAEAGSRQMVLIGGEAGIGKTSVVETFLDAPATRQACWIARGQCVTQFGPEVAYLPIVDALATLATGSSRVVAVLKSTAPAWLLQMAALTTPEERQALGRAAAGATGERLMRELAEALEALGRERTVVLWLDDLHDSDASTIELLGYLARRKPPARLLVIGTHRPAAHAAPDHPLPRIALGLRERSLCTDVSLAPLGLDAVEAYLRARLPASASAQMAALAERIHARTEGNPLFVVRVTDELLRNGAAGDEPDTDARVAAIPPTLRDLLRSQMAILPVRERETLDVASVVGMRFALQTIDAVQGGTSLEVEAVLERLAHAYQFIEREGADEWPDGTRASTYRFRHALHQEVAYHEVPPVRRAHLHERIATHREQSHAGDLGAVAVELSSHFERGGQDARAVHYCLVGFEQALQRSAFSEGLKLATRGLALLPRLPAGPARDQAELPLRMAAAVCYATSIGAASREAGDACRRALEISRQADDSITLFPPLGGLFAFYLVNADYATAEEVGTRLLRLAQAQSSRVLTLASRVALGMVTWHLGRLDDAWRHLDERRLLHTPDDHLTFLHFGHEPAVTSLSFAAPVQWYLGYPDTARRLAEDGVALGRALAHAYTQGVSLLFGARAFQESGDLARVAALIEEHEAVCRDQGFAEADARRDLSRGWLLIRQGQVPQGIASLERGLRICDGMGTGMERSYHLTVLADAHARNDDFDAARRTMAEALAQSRSTNEAYYQPEMHRLHAQMLWTGLEREGKGSAQEVETALQEALGTARALQARGLELRAASTQVRWRTWRALREPGQGAELEQAYEELAAVYGWFTEGFNTPDLREAEALLTARRT